MQAVVFIGLITGTEL